jgi:hypothetical protein
VPRREEDVPARRAQRPIGLEEQVGVPVELTLAPATTPLGQWDATGRSSAHFLSTTAGDGGPAGTSLSSGLPDNDGTCTLVVESGPGTAAWVRTEPSILPV